MERLTDVYDAALGDVLGLHLLRGSDWAVKKGRRGQGELALPADGWLSARVDQHLDVAAGAA